MKTSMKVSLGGVVAALSLVLMFLTSVIPFGTFAFPTFAGILLILLVINLGYRWAFAVYKSVIERIPSKVVQYIVKLALFNVCIIAAFFVGMTLLSIPKESFTLFGVYLPWVFLIIGNIAFVIYDLCVTKLVTLYLFKWHNKLNKNTKL